MISVRIQKEEERKKGAERVFEEIHGQKLPRFDKKTIINIFKKLNKLQVI